MQVIKKGEHMAATLRYPTNTFVGRVGQRILHEPVEPEKVELIFVQFGGGAHTNWHVHYGGQFLYLVAGKGVIQVEGASPVPLAEGDAVIAEPEERHWHGALPGEEATYIACSLGEEDWGDAPVLQDT